MYIYASQVFLNTYFRKGLFNMIIIVIILY